MSTVAVRVDDQLKDDATELFQSLGLDMSTAVKMFLIQSVKTQSIPFEIRNKSSIKANNPDSLTTKYEKEL
ncbi:type II toxin-antitoxin system RelB/DinJ family antitoxin [Streptococcus didelphis]|uniref:Type II toxin-antitoxin system RelB/DinJ family antitoxin n=1 Tax=Streptococcus didelphis TaxID=102886 RepID=A0ABY9LI49_9STRE|nr:type II toxin-antitoxin system RelB/DinJ family antitoxin [Streptococcus didelphis]WMB27840.1 type II toxin-antitoxin system RelB/DinJ family antitoxin [Streptococcus didelphis]WMB29698.1 type II toxin-antitoxin system RelB/DinJ family antitoxin [Streptococcus didelphis]